uniref:Uncharacterized protein n=1 Tax=Rhodopseudomonas palustris (strain BisA53) TaxID=316055 RepID=Q07PN0_RHOP5
MTSKNQRVIDFVERSRPKPQSVADRIKRRKVVLSEWSRDGIPFGKLGSLPNSLCAAREWDDPQLGIARIASPNDFTQAHPRYGDDVREIARLLTKLAKRYNRRALGKDKPRRAQSLTSTKKEVESQLAQCVSQWQAERHARLSEQKRADTAEWRAKVVLRENVELTRKLAAYLGPKVVT